MFQHISTALRAIRAGSASALVACLLFACASATAADPTRIVVHADTPGTRLSRYLTGACIEDVNHEIYGGLYSQMLFGESFQEPASTATPPGFQAFGGRWTVNDGVLSADGPLGPKLIAAPGDARVDEASVEMFLPDASPGFGGLIVRVNKPGLGPDNFDGYEISLDAEHQLVRLGWHGHNWKSIRDVPCAVRVGHWVSLQVRLLDNALEVFVDDKGVLRHEHGGPLPGGNAVGVRPWEKEIRYRNLKVTSGHGSAKPYETKSFPFSQSAVGDDDQVSGMWRAVRRGSPTARIRVETESPFVGNQCQRVTLASGTGEIGVANRGLNGWGLYLEADKPYEGYVWVRSAKPAQADKPVDAEKPANVCVSLESGDGEQTVAEAQLGAPTADWSRLDFTLIPSATVRGGRFVVKLRQPGSVVLGHAFLQPGEWGRFKDLPVRRDVAEAMVDQGITVLRYGGSMVNNAEYRWKKMIGPRDRRSPYKGMWYPYSSNGWGIIDFIDFCQAAGFRCIPAFNMDETPQDMADFIEYVNGPADSPWGRQRAAAGHPEPYRLRFMELGNEERVDEKYFDKFKALAEVIWAKDPDMTLVVGDFVYKDKITDPLNITGTASHITTLAAHREILKLAKAHDREVWFDVHVDTNGPGRAGDLMALSSYCQALDQLADGAKHATVVFEFNAGNHAHRRALANAVATHICERLGLPVATSANGLQPDGQNDNGWDQGLLFLNPSQVWLQPPGYVTQMISRAFQPLLLKTDVAGNPENLDASGKLSEDGKTLIVELVNTAGEACDTEIELAGFKPTKLSAVVEQLAGPLDAVNTAENPRRIVTERSRWSYGDYRPGLPYRLPPHSFTVIRFE
jgi:hypothetical protein